MLRAISTAIVGLGVTLASTFAPSLGLSVHQQRIGFAVGVVLILVAGVGLWIDRKHRSRGDSNRKLSHGIVIENSKGGCVEGNRISGFDTGVGVYDSEDIWTRENEISKSDGAPDFCGDPEERLDLLLVGANQLANVLKNFDNWLPAVMHKRYEDKLPDGTSTVTHAEAMQALLFAFAQFFSAAWIYEDHCRKEWHRRTDIKKYVREVYEALGKRPIGPKDDETVRSDQLHSIGELSTEGWRTAQARPLGKADFEVKVKSDPLLAEALKPLGKFLRKAGPDTEAHARVEAAEKSLQRVKECLPPKYDQP